MQSRERLDENKARADAEKEKKSMQDAELATTKLRRQEDVRDAKAKAQAEVEEEAVESAKVAEKKAATEVLEARKADGDAKVEAKVEEQKGTMQLSEANILWYRNSFW